MKRCFSLVLALILLMQLVFAAGAREPDPLDMAFVGVEADVDISNGSITFTGQLTGASGAAVSATLETATGRQIWSGDVVTDTDGVFHGEISVEVQPGDAMVLSLSAAGAEAYRRLRVASGDARPEPAEIAELTITPDVSGQKFTVIGKTEPAGAREIAMLVTKDGSVVHVDQFMTEEDGSFHLEFGADMQVGDTFLFRFNGVTLKQPVERLVPITEAQLVFEDVAASGDAAADQVAFSGTLAGAGGGEVISVTLLTATGKVLWQGSVTAEADGSFQGSAAVALEAGDVLVLTLEAENAKPSSTLFVVPGGAQPELAEITELTITPDVSGQKFTVIGKTEPAGAREIAMLVTKDGSVVHVDQFMTEEDGSFHLEFGADMQVGDTFLFRFNGVTLKQPVERLVTIEGERPGSSGSGHSVTYHYRYMLGYPEGTFQPGDEITRAEVSMIFARLLSDRYEFSGDYEPGFPDVQQDVWYADCVGFLEQKGIVEGDPDGHFRPEDPISRAEFAAMAVRMQELTESEVDRFSDVSETHWAYGYIGRAAERGWINGYGDGTFRPEDDITRAEATSLIHRMLGRTCTKAFVQSHPEWTSFSDVPETFWAYVEIMCAANTHTH